jgi:REP element-mobilizing transposase RayT
MVKQTPLNVFLFVMGLYYQLTQDEVDPAVQAMLAKIRTADDGSVIRFMLHFIPNHYYHITHHVAEQLQWVTDEAELAIVRAALDRASRTHHIQVIAWNIMSNHVHLIIRTTTNSHVSKFMQSFLGGAVQKINRHMSYIVTFMFYFSNSFKFVFCIRPFCYSLCKGLHPFKSGICVSFK